jgi:DNA-binding IclR family transcriptional regulator
LTRPREAQHPDEFLANHLNLVPGTFCAAVRKVRARLKNPPYTVQEYLNTLTQQGLVVTVTELGQYAQVI